MRNSKAGRTRDAQLPQMPTFGLSGTPSSTPPRGRGRGRSTGVNKPGAPNNRVRVTSKKPTSAWGNADKDSSHPREQTSSRRRSTQVTPTRPTQRPPEPEPIEQSTPPPQMETPTKSNGTETKTQSKGWSDFDDDTDNEDDFFQTKLDAETLNNPPRKPPPKHQPRRRQQPPPQQQPKRPPPRTEPQPVNNPWGISRPPQGNIPKSSFFNPSNDLPPPPRQQPPQPEYEEPEDPIPPVVREVVRPKPRNGRGNRKRQQEQFYEEYDYQEPPQQTVHRRRPSKQKRQVERRFASLPCDAQPPKLEPHRRENYQRRLVEVQERLKKQNEMNQAIAERRKMLEETRKRDWIAHLQTKAVKDAEPISMPTTGELSKEEATGEREGEYDESYGNDDSKDWSQKSSGQADWGFPDHGQTQVTAPAMGTPQQIGAATGGTIPAVSLGGGTNPQAQPFQPMAFGATTFQQMEQHHHFPAGNGTAAQYYTPAQMWGYSDQLAQVSQPTGSSSLSVHSQPFQPSYAAYGSGMTGMYDQGAAAAAALTGQYYGTQAQMSSHHGYPSGMYDQSYAYQTGTQPIQNLQQMQMSAAAAAPAATAQQQQHPSAQYLQQAAPQTQQHFMYQ